MRMLLVLVAMVLASPAIAISKYNAATMSCDAARNTIVSEGAVILRFRSGPNRSIPRFGRFVADNGFCTPGEIAEWSYIPTTDVKSCPVLECKDFDYDDFELWRKFRD